MKNGVNSTEESCQSVPPQGRQPQHGDGTAILRWCFGEESELIGGEDGGVTGIVVGVAVLSCIRMDAKKN